MKENTDNNEIKKKKEKKEKRKIDKRKLFTQIMAGILALLMVLAVAMTLLFYIFQ